MATKKTIEVKDTTQDSDIYGYFGGSITYTPQTLKDKKVPKAKQFTVDIEPMNDEDCTTINSLNKQEQLRMSLWYVSEDGKKFQEANEKLKAFTGNGSNFTDEDFASVQLLQAHRAKISNDKLKFEIVQKYVSNLSEPHPKAKSGVIRWATWNGLPVKIRADIYNEIVNISMLSEEDAINLQ